MKQSMYEKACDYIDYKKRLGYQYRMESYMLRSFGNYADINAPGESFRIKTVIEWASLPHGDRSYHTKRLSALRPFVRHLLISDCKPRLFLSMYSDRVHLAQKRIFTRPMKSVV